MPSRRSVLSIASSTLAVSIAGCMGDNDGEPPAGSLLVTNRDSLPHDIRMAVTGVGTTPGEEDGTVTGDPENIPGDVSFTMTAHLDGDTTETFESVFIHPVWYALQFTIDGQVPETREGKVAFNPAPANEDRGRILRTNINDGSSFGWSIAATDNNGAFDI